VLQNTVLNTCLDEAKRCLPNAAEAVIQRASESQADDFFEFESNTAEKS